METKDRTSASEQLRQIERHKVQVYASANKPAWAWPSFGVLVFLFFCSYEIRATWARIVFPLLYALSAGVWAGLVARFAGVQPRLRGMPPPLRRQIYLFWLLGAIAAALLVALGLTVSFLVAGVLGGVLTVAGGIWSDRRYRRVAAAISSPAAAS